MKTATNFDFCLGDAEGQAETAQEEVGATKDKLFPYL